MKKTKASIEESLKKLKTDYIDLVLIHQCLSDYYGAYHALEDLYDEGKIRAMVFLIFLLSVWQIFLLSIALYQR